MLGFGVGRGSGSLAAIVRLYDQATSAASTDPPAGIANASSKAFGVDPEP